MYHLQFLYFWAVNILPITNLKLNPIDAPKCTSVAYTLQTILQFTNGVVSDSFRTIGYIITYHF